MADRERAPSCDRLNGIALRTHTGPDANQLCLKCKRWVIWRECFGCKKQFLRLKHNRENWYCAKCSESFGI